jgi:hypothetical protein
MEAFMEFVTGDRVKVVGDHPHKGQTATFTGERTIILGASLYKVALDDGSFTDSCYVDLAEIRSLPEDEDPLS